MSKGLTIGLGVIAAAALFFASDESGYITGDSVNVMGGRYIS